MNRKRFVAAVILIGGAFVFAASGQTPATQPRPQPAAPQTAAPARSKVAVIYSLEFQDPKSGIAKFTVLLNQLNTQFQKTQDDLNATAQRLRTMQEEIVNLQKAPTPQTALIQTKIEQLDQQKTAYSRRGEDAQRQYQQRRQELFDPLQEAITKALDEFAKARGIGLIIDGSRVPLIYADPSIDVTKTFITEYNSKNPATASTTTPR